MKRWLIACVSLILLVGCSAREPLIKYELVEVKVPIQIRATPPPELMAPLKAPLPVFIDPKDPMASSGLSKQGEENIKRLLLEMNDRLKAWPDWAGS